MKNSNSKGFRLIPLILLIPAFAVIAALFLIDEPESVSDVTGSNDDSIPVELVVGQAGSLQNDVGEPIYAEPDITSEKVGTLQYNCCVLPAYIQENDDWICVQLSDEETTGYVLRDNVMERTINVRSSSPVRMKIVKDAMDYIGLPFIRYGDSLETGIDCSNFVNKIYAINGIEIPTTPNEIRASGQIITEDEAQPGDIVYYYANNGGGHVGIYMGDGFQINSTGHSGRVYPEGGVRICALQYRDREDYIIVNVLDQ